MLIDMHTHVCPAAFDVPEELRRNKRMPCMCATALGAADMLIEEKLFRKLDLRSWDVSRRLEDMARDGVSRQVLSPMPELLSYWFNPQDGAMMCDCMNGVIAAMIAAAPTQFRGLGMVPLQDVSASAEYLHRIKSEFGLAGVQIGTNILGVQLGDARFNPFWEAAEALDLAIFIHPLHPMTARALPDATPLFHPLVGFPLDIALSGASLLLAGVTERFPRLRLALSHGGGGLAPIIHRMDQAWASMASARTLLRAKPSEMAARFFYDTNVYDQSYLSYLAAHVAPGQMFLGTDYPYEIMQTAPASYLAGLELSKSEVASLAFGAALRFLGEA
jgi:aminocarboxymuconate-semialdehyde decarboxylase